MSICKHCDNNQEDCDKRTKLWRERQLLVCCIEHVKTYEHTKGLLELTDPITCGRVDCKADGVWLVKMD